jgi:hypothetical protein
MTREVLSRLPFSCAIERLLFSQEREVARVDRRTEVMTSSEAPPSPTMMSPSARPAVARSNPQ